MIALSTYRVTFVTDIRVEVEVNAHDEHDADQTAWEIADAYLQGVAMQRPDSRIADVTASLESIGPDRVERLS